MKMKLLPVWAACILAAVSFCRRREPVVDAVVSVDGKRISRAQVMRVADLLRQQVVGVYPEKALDGMSPEILKGAAAQLVANEVLLGEAARRGIAFDSVRADSAYARICARIGDQAAVIREFTRMGETEESVRGQIREGAVLDSLMKTLIVGVDSATELERKEFYEKNRDKYVTAPRVRASQILFPLDTSAGDSARKAVLMKAATVLEKIKGGAKFGEMASRHSAMPTSDGDIGWFGRGDLKPELDQALQAMKVGQVSEILKSEAGLHIVKKTGEEPGKSLPYSEVKDHVKVMVELKNRNRFVTAFIDSLVKISDVVYLDTSFTPVNMARANAVGDTSLGVR